MPPRRKPSAPQQDPELPIKRSRGVLMGMAVGDGLGAPFAARLLSAPPFPGLGTLPPGGAMRGGGPRELRRGQVLDDTHMACCIVASLRQWRRYDLRDVVNRYLAWKPHSFGMDEVVKEVLEEMEGSTPALRFTAGRRVWARRGRKAATNASLGRTAPLAVFYARDEQARLQASFVDSAITHFDPRCQLACAALNASLAFAITAGPDLKAEQLLTAALSGLHVAAATLGRAEKDYVQYVDEALQLLKEDLALAQRDDPCLYGPETHLYQHQHSVRVTFRLAYWELLHARSFEQALLDVVSRGGDASTNAAVTGALMGAYLGDAAIPQPWLQTVMAPPPNAMRMGPLWTLYHPNFLLTMPRNDPPPAPPQKSKPAPGRPS